VDAFYGGPGRDGVFEVPANCLGGRHRQDRPYSLSTGKDAVSDGFLEGPRRIVDLINNPPKGAVDEGIFFA
jgi:hypothetical protein